MRQAGEGSIAFILPTYGQFDYAELAAASFFENTANPYLIFVDDASPDYKENEVKPWLSKYPEDRVKFYRFTTNGGLTRSWNAGLAIAADLGVQYAMPSNSDVVFAPGWENGLVEAIASGFDIVGPVTNAPGRTCFQQQYVRTYKKDYRVDQSWAAIAQTQEYLQAKQHPPVSVKSVNGFCMFAELDRWMAGAFSRECVFDPKYRITGNEDELQKRWRNSGGRAAVVPTSFVFHYRAATRGASFTRGAGDIARIDKR